MEQIPESESTQSNSEYALPFQVKEEIVSSDEESGEISQPPQKTETSKEAFKHDNSLMKKKVTKYRFHSLAELEKAFAASPYLAPRHRYAMAARLGVKPVAIQTVPGRK
ncbi:unnamed protein product, partial [Porites evermanni]